MLALPGGRRALERQRRVAALVAATTPAAPDRLHARIASQVTQRDSSRPRPVARPWVVTIGGVAAVFISALAVMLSAGTGSPSVARAAELVAKPATSAAPSVSPGKPSLLDRSLQGVAFPNWTSEFGWRAHGARSDSLEGRQAETVFYEHRGHRIGYTVVSGDALDIPEHARRVMANGVDVWLYSDGPRDVAVFERRGHTCIVAGEVLRQSTLVELAAWQGSGSVQFSLGGAHH